jgi:hypothetical protein
MTADAARNRHLHTRPEPNPSPSQIIITLLLTSHPFVDRTHLARTSTSTDMAKFFRMSLAGELSDSSDDSPCHSGLSSPERSASPASQAPLQPHSNDRDGSSSPEARNSDDYPIDRPTLPLRPSQIVAIRGKHNSIFPPPRELPAAIVQDLLRWVPTRDWSDEDDLASSLGVLDRFDCDGIDAWLQVVDPGTGNSLVHAIVLSGRVGALGVCQLYPTCGRGAHLGVREQYMLLTHQNHDGDTGLHLAARMGSLPMVKGLLRLGRRKNLVAEAPGEFDRPKNETGAEMSDFCDDTMILFIEARNNGGRNAIQEARQYAREEVVVFLEYVLDRSYPAGCVDRVSVKSASRLAVDRRYNFKTSEEEV